MIGSLPSSRAFGFPARESPTKRSYSYLKKTHVSCLNDKSSCEKNAAYVKFHLIMQQLF